MKQITHIAALATLAATTLTSQAGTAAADPKKAVAPIEESKSICDSIFDLATLYENKENPYIQKVAIKGRYHGQYYYLDSNQGNADDWENRRSRIGLDVKFLKNFTLGLEFNLNLEDNGERFFHDLEEAKLSYSSSKEFKLDIGKFKAPLSWEWRQSSNKMPIIERTRIVGQTVPGRLGGVLVSGDVNGFLYEAGLYSGSLDEDWLWPSFDGSVAAYGSVGYKSKEWGTVRGEYLWTDVDENNNGTKGYEHLASVNYQGQWDKFGVAADVLYAAGNPGVPDVWGFYVIPTYEITDRLQAVLRYQYASSDKENGVSLPSRYEREAPELITTRGDQYQAVYAGLNFDICEDHLKLMAGVEYADFDQVSGDNFNSWTYFGAVRLFF